MNYNRFRAYFILFVMVFSFLNVGFFIDGLVFLNDNQRSSAASNIGNRNLNSLSGSIFPVEGNFSGSGNQLSAKEYGQIQGTQQGLITNTSFQVSYADWNATAVRIDASQMAVNASTVGEMQMQQAIALPNGALPNPTGRFAQEIQIPFLTTYLMSISLYLFIEKFYAGADIYIELWNATDVGGFKPDRLIQQKTGFDIGTGDPKPDYSDWFTLTFSTPVALKTSQTVGSRFYIAVLQGGTGTPGGIWWYGANDTLEGDEFNAWVYSSGSWSSYGFDFSLNTTLRGSPLPSEANLRINGTLVSDIISGNGTYYSIFSNNLKSPLLFTITAKFKVSLTLIWILNISKMQAFNSNFYIQREWTYSKWNATKTVDFLTNAYNRGMNITIPRWNVERVVWNGGLYSNWTVAPYGAWQRITVSNATTGTWTIECTSTNYIQDLLVHKGAISTFIVNATDTISISTSFKQKLTTGSANLTVFPTSAANYNDSVQISGSTSIQFTPWTINNTATENPGIFTLQVMWYNGTEVGLNATSITILSIPTKLTCSWYTPIVGPLDPIGVYVNFFNSYSNKPLIDASLLVKDNSTKAEWTAQIINVWPNGTYNLEISTLGVVDGDYDLSIALSKPLYLSSEVVIFVTIGGGPSNISTTTPGCRGLLKINGSYAVANPAPYHNTTMKVRVYYYNPLNNQSLKGGLVSGSWIDGGPEVIGSGDGLGYYNITIDVTGFHAGTNHTLRMTLQQIGYSAAELYIIVPIKKIPTIIEPLQMAYEAYLEQPVTIYAVFENTLSGQSIPSVYDLNGCFTIQVNGFKQNMTRLLPTLGLYTSTLILSELALEEGQNYTMTLFAFSQEHELSIINVSLHIILRAPSYIVLMGLPPIFLAGIGYKFYAQVTSSNGTPLYNIPLIYKRIYSPGGLIVETTEITNRTGVCELTVMARADMENVTIQVQYLGNSSVQNGMNISAAISIKKFNSAITLSNLPTEIQEGETLEVNATLLINGVPAAGQIIKFTFIYDGADTIDILSIETNAQGVATAALIVPTGVTRLYITAAFEGLSYINASSETGNVSIYSFMTLVWRYAYIWLTITLAAIGSILIYKYGYKRTKDMRLKVKWVTSAQKYQNALNLNFLMMVLKNSGLSIYNYSFKGEKVDYELMSGFLSAISMFKRELIKTEKKEAVKKPEWEMNYQEFKIFGVDRELVQYIFILEESPSESLKKMFQEFITNVEDKFHEGFAKFRGDTTEFKEIDSLIKYHFDTTLIMPHYTVNLSNEQLKQLSDLERQIYNLGLMFMKQQGYFYIPNLMTSIAEMSKKDRNQIFHEIYGLIQKNYFTSSKMSLLLG